VTVQLTTLLTTENKEQTQKLISECFGAEAARQSTKIRLLLGGAVIELSPLIRSRPWRYINVFTYLLTYLLPRSAAVSVTCAHAMR